MWTVCRNSLCPILIWAFIDKGQDDLKCDLGYTCPSRKVEPTLYNQDWKSDVRYKAKAIQLTTMVAWKLPEYQAIWAQNRFKGVWAIPSAHITQDNSHNKGVRIKTGP